MTGRGDAGAMGARCSALDNVIATLREVIYDISQLTEMILRATLLHSSL